MEESKAAPTAEAADFSMPVRHNLPAIVGNLACTAPACRLPPNSPAPGCGSSNFKLFYVLAGRPALASCLCFNRFVRELPCPFGLALFASLLTSSSVALSLRKGYSFI